MDKTIVTPDEGVHALYHHICIETKDLNIRALDLKMEVITREHPEILYAQCDDSSFMSSSIYLIPHRNSNQLMGYTMMIVPQCEERTYEVFLYPYHAKTLYEALKQIMEPHAVHSKEI